MPLRDYTPVLRIHNQQLTSAVLFKLQDFEEFLSKITNMLLLMKNVLKDVVLGDLKNYMVILSPHQIIHFKSKNSDDDVYKPLYLAVDTVRTVIDFGEHLVNLLQTPRIKHKCYPDYNMFILNVALYIMEHGCHNNNFDKILLDIVKSRYEKNPTLYEICFKLPCTVKKDVDEKIRYFLDHDNFNYE
ncbi:hypothetical protein BDFB_012950 [Asbolus verrucosus]|uniref:Uncharacterized protein n=1 Tax=Asbolus verrucosus TaxID=1661398 RepID=A0A482VLJ0_ASBVE|nr:hypothetical protein BDFB_012950 [Asbolus verrucosus]